MVLHGVHYINIHPHFQQTADESRGYPDTVDVELRIPLVVWFSDDGLSDLEKSSALTGLRIIVIPDCPDIVVNHVMAERAATLRSSSCTFSG